MRVIIITIALIMVIMDNSIRRNSYARVGQTDVQM